MGKKPKSSNPKKQSSKNKTPEKTSPSIEKKDFWNNTFLQSILIAVIAFGIYANTLNHEFAQDDAIVITDNMYTKQGVSGIGSLLKYDTFKGFFKVEGKDKLVAGGRYRPLTPILFALQWQIFAKDKIGEDGKAVLDAQGNIVQEANPWFFHFINILFYVLCCLMVFWTLLELLKGEGEKFRHGVAFVSALLFAVHPLHTEAVANIKGADEVLTLLLSLAALFFTLRAIREKNFTKAIYAGVAFFLALLAKENAITFLAIIPFAIYFSKDLDLKKSIPQLLPIGAAAVLFLIIRFSVLGADFGDNSLELMNNPYLKVEGSKYVPFSSGEKMATITYTLGKYVQLFFVPHTLTHDYYPRAIEIMQFSNIKVLLSLLLYGFLIFFSVRSLKNKDWIGYGLLFFLASLSIVSNIVFPVGTNMSERFLFMPSVGLCFALSVFVFRLLEKRETSVNTLIVIFAIPALLFAGKTVLRNKAWKDNFTLFMTDIENSPRSAKLLNSVGAELIVQSQKPENSAKMNQMIQTAIGHLNEAVKIHPNFENAFLQLGNAHTYLKQPQKAIPFYDKVLRLDPNDKDAFNNKGVALRDAGKYADAIQYFSQLTSMGYPQSEVDIKLAYVYEVAGKKASEQGNQDLAIEYFEKGLKIGTEKDKLTYFLGVAYALKNDLPKAISTLENAIRLTEKPENKVNIYSEYRRYGKCQQVQPVDTIGLLIRQNWLRK